MAHVHFLINSMITHAQPGDSLSLQQRACQYGDGCFTTMRVSNGQPCMLSEHLQRLRADTYRLHIAFTQWDDLALALYQASNRLGSGVLKVLISAGKGGRGYSRDSQVQADVWLTEHRLPEHYRHWQSQGINVGVSKLRLAMQPALAGIKHLNRLEQVLIKRELAASEFDDLLVCDQQDKLVEASAANVFWLSKGRWHTPCLSQCGVAGVMRRFLLAHFIKQGQPARVVSQGKNVLMNADAIFICNALMQVVPVSSLIDSDRRQVFSMDAVFSLQQELP